MDRPETKDAGQRLSAEGKPGSTGADTLCDTLLAAGVDTCFANPGTSEMHFVAAHSLVTHPDIRLDVLEHVAEMDGTICVR